MIRIYFNLLMPQESDLPSWQLIATADDVRNKSFLEIFVDVLPMSSSSKALANATTVCYVYICSTLHMFVIPDSRAVN